MQQGIIQQIAMSLISNTPELAIWCWALLKTLHPERAQRTFQIRLAMMLMMFLLLGAPILYAVLFASINVQRDPSSYMLVVQGVSFCLSFVHAWCWYVVLKAALENRRELPLHNAPEPGYQLPDTSGR